MKWTIDTAHSEVGFAVKHLMISTVKGRFKTFTGTGETNADGSLKSVELSIEAPSIDTNVQARDDHLRSPDFFDVANHPTLTFRSTKITHDGSDVTITGELTMHGATKPVTLKGEFATPVKDPWGNQRAALQVSAKLNRKDWGLHWNQLLEAGGMAVGEEVRITVEVEATAVQVPEPVAA